jgi:UDP-N-acetylmuramate--alanine ligase
VAVAGSAGKTTTTALIAFLLSKAGLNPGFLVGGIVPDLGASGRWGDPAAPLVIEADEYDRAFLALQPWLAVVTNVEWDHVDIYPTFTKYLAAFGQFAAQSETLIADPETWPGLRELPRSGSLITYGGSGCDWQVGAARVEHGRTYASARFTGEPALDIRFGMHLHGSHNVRNATAALVVAQRLGLNMAEATLALLEFRGTGRRFELKGERRGITVIDDYAHHPAKVRATLEAARMLYGQRRIVVYMQPHTFSRTRALLDDWPAALAGGDEVLIGDIYGAREELSAGDPVSGAILAERVARSHPRARYVGDLAGAAAAALALLRPGDVLLTLGAGDGYLVGEQVLREL